VSICRYCTKMLIKLCHRYVVQTAEWLIFTRDPSNLLPELLAPSAAVRKGYFGLTYNTLSYFLSYRLSLFYFPLRISRLRFLSNDLILGVTKYGSLLVTLQFAVYSTSSRHYHVLDWPSTLHNWRLSSSKSRDAKNWTNIKIWPNEI